MKARGLKILVVDDKEINRKSAVALLSEGNKVDVVESSDKALEVLEGEMVSIRERKPHGYDMVLIDLLMPAGEHCMGNNGMKYVGNEMPIGIFLALLAAKNGAKYVAIASDMNHHDHPASAWLDPICSGVKLNGAKFIAFNDGPASASFKEGFGKRVEFWDAHVDANNLKPGFVDAKDWAEIAGWLLEDDSKL